MQFHLCSKSPLNRFIDCSIDPDARKRELFMGPLPILGNRKSSSVVVMGSVRSINISYIIL